MTQKFIKDLFPNSFHKRCVGMIIPSCCASFRNHSRRPSWKVWMRFAGITFLESLARVSLPELS
jgi:hypothetical protein